MVCMKAQGATEYLVLLAVVLIVALVSVALLGFFPGMASDAQMTQSKTYWSSANPISITEWDARMYTGDGPNYYSSGAYLRLRNSGMYRVQITKIIAGSNSISQIYYNPTHSIVTLSSFADMAPGEEKMIEWSGFYPSLPIAGTAHFWFCSATCPWWPHAIFGATSFCSTDAANRGTLVVPNFGFEYVEYIDGQQITKRQVGAKPLVIKCSG